MDQFEQSLERLVDGCAARPVEWIDEYASAPAAPVLRPYVAGYQGYRQRGLPPTLHRGLASPFLTLILTLDEPVTLLAHPDPRQAPGSYPALLAGLHTRAALIGHAGAQSGVQVALHPLGARALLGLPAGELAGADVPAEAVLGDRCGELCERLRAADGWPARFAVLDAALLGRVAPGRAPAPEVAHAWRRLRRSGGNVPVAELARETGWSARHLGNRFRAEIGLAPKAAGRVVRFDRARRLLARQARGGHGTGTLAAVAAECGYFDQAHLAREFRALAGCAPSRWLAEEHPAGAEAAGGSTKRDVPGGPGGPGGLSTSSQTGTRGGPGASDGAGGSGESGARGGADRPHPPRLR